MRTRKHLQHGQPRSEKAVDRDGQRRSEQIRASRLKPLRGAAGVLDTLICPEALAAVAIDGAERSKFGFERNKPMHIP
jgi:hypothetical protein